MRSYGCLCSYRFSAFKNLFLDIPACLSRTGWSRFWHVSWWNSAAHHFLVLVSSRPTNFCMAMLSSFDVNVTTLFQRYESSNEINVIVRITFRIQYDSICVFVVVPLDVIVLFFLFFVWCRCDIEITSVTVKSCVPVIEYPSQKHSNPIGRRAFPPGRIGQMERR